MRFAYDSTIDIALTGTPWHLRMSEVLTALLTLGIGARLVMKPSVIYQYLRRWGPALRLSRPVSL